MTQLIPNPRVVSILVALLIVTGATTLAAQSDLDAAQAEAFIGDWDVTLETPDGDVPFTLHIADMDGKVAARLGDGAESQQVEKLELNGEKLVASYTMDYQGMDLPVMITLTRDGEDLQSDWDFAGGMYTTSAVATKH